jgi:hypothetical protein
LHDDNKSHRSPLRKFNDFIGPINIIYSCARHRSQLRSAASPRDHARGRKEGRIAIENQRSQFAITDVALDHGRDGADHVLYPLERTRILQEDQSDDQKDSSDAAIARVGRVTFDHPPLNIFGPETIPGSTGFIGNAKRER